MKGGVILDIKLKLETFIMIIKLIHMIHGKIVILLIILLIIGNTIIMIIVEIMKEQILNGR